MEVLQGSRLRLRPVEDADVETLLVLLRDPAVARFWGTADDEEYGQELRHGTAREPGAAAGSYVMELAGDTVGWIQWWEEPLEDYRHAGIDLFVAAAHHGRGFGPEAIRLVCRYLFDVQGHHRVTIDPAAHNDRAIRAYEKVGFRRVGVMREYERGPDGTFHDGLLLDLLQDELTP